MVDVGAVDHHAVKQAEFRDRLADQVDVLAQCAGIERHRLQRTTTHGRPFGVLFVIRMRRVWTEMRRRFALQLGDCLRCAVDKRIAHIGGRAIAHHRVQEATHFLRAVGIRTARRRHFMGVQRIRHPGCRRRQSGGAADIFGAFDDKDALAGNGSEDRRRQAARARADDHEVEDGVFSQSREFGFHDRLNAVPWASAGNPPSGLAARCTSRCPCRSHSPKRGRRR